MAGLFAPELGGINSAARDTIIPDSAFAGVANILNTVQSGLGSRGGAEKETQKDRDNATLRPVAEEFARLNSLHKRGELSDTSFNAQLTTLSSQAITANPMLRDDILDLGGDITGKELGVRQVNAVDELPNLVNESFKTDPVLTAALPSILLASRDSKTGEVDGAAAQEMMFQKFFEQQARVASLATQKRELETLETQNKLTGERGKEILSGVMADQSKRANDHVNGLWGAAALGDVSNIDMKTTRTSVMQAKAQAAAQFEAEARAGGLFKLEGYDLEKILAPYDNIIKIMDAVGEDAAKFNQFLRDKNSIIAIEALNKNGVIATPETLEIIGREEAFTSIEGIAKAAQDMATVLEGLNPAIDGPGTSGVYTLDGAIDENAIRAAGQMDTSAKRARVNSANKTLEIYGADIDVNNQEQRDHAANEYGKLVAVLTSENKIMGGTTFDATYNDKFISAYTKITAADTDSSRAFQNNVAQHLSLTISGVKNRIDQTVQNQYSTWFNGTQVVGENGKFKVVLGEASTEVGQKILDGLKSKGLEPTVAGVRELMKDRSFFVGTNLPVGNAMKEIVGLTQKDLEYVNRVTAFASRLPGQEPIVPANSQGVTVDANTPPADQVTPEDTKGGIAFVEPEVEEVLFPHIEEWEGLRLSTYKDTGGVLTIGYGHTGPEVKEGMTITQEEAQRLYREDSASAARTVTRETEGMSLTPEQKASLISFTFNVGSSAFRRSTLLRKLKAGDMEGAANEFKRWKFDNGEEVAGLLNRRKSEEELFRSGIQTAES